MDLSLLPPLNASLNLLSASLLVLGFYQIRRKHVAAHRACMLGACLASVLFLASYLYYHAHHGITRYQGTGFIRIVYFTVLSTHTVLAAVIVPLIGTVLGLIAAGKTDLHRRLARITLPLWLYVAVTGVLIYWMLYQVKY